MKKHYPYEAKKDRCSIWWVESSFPHDSTVLSSDVLLSEECAEICALHCNAAYKEALEDAKNKLLKIGIDASSLIDELIKGND